MTTSIRGTARGFGLALAVASGVAGAVIPALAQDVTQVAASTLAAPAEPLPGTGGEFVFHGNYCGPGSRGPGLPPVDALDAACMRHDACSPPLGTGLPSCGCNARLSSEASLVARSPRTPDDVRVAAAFVSEGAKVLACR